MNADMMRLRDAALGRLLEARRLLEQLVALPGFEQGSPPEATLDYLEDAIGMLTPDLGDGVPDAARPKLRVVGGRR